MWFGVGVGGGVGFVAGQVDRRFGLEECGQGEAESDPAGGDERQVHQLHYRLRVDGAVRFGCG